MPGLDAKKRRSSGSGEQGERRESLVTESVTASRTKFPRMLRQARVGDLLEGGVPGRGPEVTWVDMWTGQGWAGPMGSVYFCASCQLA